MSILEAVYVPGSDGRFGQSSKLNLSALQRITVLPRDPQSGGLDDLPFPTGKSASGWSYRAVSILFVSTLRLISVCTPGKAFDQTEGH